MPDYQFPKLSLDSQLLYDRLITAQPGEVIGYPELSGLIGRDVQTEAYQCLYTARNKARNVNRLAFGVIPTVGLKCLDDVEVVGAGYAMVGQLRGRACRGLKTIRCIQDYPGLPDPVKLKHNAVAAVLMMTNHVTKPKKLLALEAFIQTTMEQLTFKQTLLFFEKK